MAAIIRVKRRRDEDPAEALLISCKRQKNDLKLHQEEKCDDTVISDTEVTSLLKFAGTVSDKNDTVSKPIRDAIRKEKLEKEYKRHARNLPWMQREQQRQISQSHRYKILASHRAPGLEKLDLSQDQNDDLTERNSDTAQETPTSELTKTVLSADDKEGKHESTKKSEASGASESPSSEKIFCLYDVESDTLLGSSSKNNNNLESTESSNPAHIQTSVMSEFTCNSVPMIRETVPQHSSTDANFVYDLYYTNSQNLDFRMFENILTIQAFQEDFLVDDRLDEDEYREVYDDEDDSNEEDNWRNDYPDEDPLYFENAEAEYYYGEDAVGNHLFDEEQPLSDWMASRCNIEDETELSSNDEGGDFQFNPVGGPRSSYESYYRRIMKEMNEDDDYKDS